MLMIEADADRRNRPPTLTRNSHARGWGDWLRAWARRLSTGHVGSRRRGRCLIWSSGLW